MNVLVNTIVKLYCTFYIYICKNISVFYRYVINLYSYVCNLVCINVVSKIMLKINDTIVYVCKYNT